MGVHRGKMEKCFQCGNCQQNEPMYYCTAKNEFVIVEQTVERDRTKSVWKKGHPQYEKRRRKFRQDSDDLKKIV